jgi:hypothetical protein
MEYIEQFLTIPLWQSVGIIVAFVVPVLLYLLQRKRKALSYNVVSITPLLNVEEEEEGRLKILFDDKQVLDPYLVIFDVLNSGDVPITQTDYDEQVRVFFKAKKVLSAKVIKTNPKGIKAKVDVFSDNVALNPVLLNGGDSIRLKIFLEKYEYDIDVDGRIVGVKNIQPLSVNTHSVFWVLLSYGAMITGLAILLYGTYHHLLEISVIGIIFCVSGFFFGVKGMFYSRILSGRAGVYIFELKTRIFR